MSDIEIIEGDCLSVLPTLEAGSVDCVITDPPFSEVTHQGARTRTIGANSDPLVNFPEFDAAQFLRFTTEAVRVARRWVVMFCDWRHAALLEPAGLPLVRLGVWIKPNSAPQLTGDRPATGWEAIALLHREGRKRWNGGGKRAVWEFNRVDAKHHPTEKPAMLLRDLIRQFTDPGERVLDPFAGSGTTGVAAMKAGRRAILIEKDPRYIPVIRRRIAEASTPLFDALTA